MSDNEFGPPSLTGVKFAYSTLENALPAIVDEVQEGGVLMFAFALVMECTRGWTYNLLPYLFLKVEIMWQKEKLILIFYKLTEKTIDF